MSIRIVPAILAAAVSVAFGFPPANAQQPQRPQPPQSLRLYVLDCGKITPATVEQYGLKPSEMANTEMITPCFLIAHPRGTMIWDTGEIPDSAFQNGVSPQKLNAYTVERPLLPLLAVIGYTPADITYLALSHYHADHVANASLFAKSTWIVQKGDRDPILAPRPVGQPSRVPDPKFFAGLADSKTVLLNGEDHDVFGDGTVHAGSYARAPVPIPQARQHRERPIVGRSLSLSGRDRVQKSSGHRPEQGADRKEPRDDRRICETEPRAAVDPARLHRRD
jgi:hypothetical protein